MSDMVLRVAAKAVIVNSEGKILVLREAGPSDTYKDGTNPGHYHVPGGRLETGEAFIDGLHREIAEETGLQGVSVGDAIHVDEWRPIINGTQQQIIGVFLLCEYNGGNVRLSDEHDDFMWLNPDERDKVDLLPAERAAIDAYVKLRD